MQLAYGRVRLVPLTELDHLAWRRAQAHLRDPEIAHLNGTPPSRLPLWLLKRILLADSRRTDRETFGILDEHGQYIGLIELYDLHGTSATLGIVIGERTHWSRGYGPEAIEALLEYAFTRLGLDRVQLSTFADNPRGRPAFTKAGFHETRRTPAPGGRTDIWMCAYRDQWLSQREARRTGLSPGSRTRSTP